MMSFWFGLRNGATRVTRWSASCLMSSRGLHLPNSKAIYSNLGIPCNDNNEKGHESGQIGLLPQYAWQSYCHILKWWLIELFQSCLFGVRFFKTTVFISLYIHFRANSCPDIRPQLPSLVGFLKEGHKRCIWLYQSYLFLTQRLKLTHADTVMDINYRLHTTMHTCTQQPCMHTHKHTATHTHPWKKPSHTSPP